MAPNPCDFQPIGSFQGLRKESTSPGTKSYGGSAPARREVVAEAAYHHKPRETQIADLETILKETDACGVGFIASLKNVPSHDVVEKVRESPVPLTPVTRSSEPG